MDNITKNISKLASVFLKRVSKLALKSKLHAERVTTILLYFFFHFEKFIAKTICFICSIRQTVQGKALGT